MKAKIIAIGDELLIGQVLDTNSNWLAQSLTKMGLKIQSISCIADEERSILYHLKEAEATADLIIFTGGLGPTKDDITKETLKSYFSSDWKKDDDTLNKISSWFKKQGRTMIDENISQAMVPSNAIVLPNYIGTAPGMWFNWNDTIIVSLPGVPYEMKQLFLQEVQPRLEHELSSSEIEHKTLVVSGIPESLLSKELTQFEAELPNDIQLSYLPNFQAIRLRLTDYKPRENRVLLEYEKLKEATSSYLIAEGDQQIEEIVGNLLLEKNATVSFAESCSGGNIAHKMTSVPGSSRYFEGGIVAYSYNIKETNLGIDHSLLLEKGAVSQEIVEEMAKAVRLKMDTDYSIAVSGIAGPGGGTVDKPVGTVWIATCGPIGVQSKVFHFRGDRQKVIEHTTASALEFLRRMVVESVS